ncbi:hypothetical protein AGMMS49546_15830 [Spirochaetia bacterium]|nr:hypothetical protein AGMMS49546_15830 [Spirochaetia bacterium]
MNILISDRNRKLIFTLVIFFIISFSVISAQEALKSTEEEYYDFLALQGFTERPTLNYRTLSDSVWTIKEGASHPWENQNLGTKRRLFDLLDLKIYGPELFNSINTAAPYGQNDGALWQGKGYNLSLTAGARLEAYGFELTYKPQVAFSQNVGFDIMPSNYDSEYGYFWGYGHNIGVDAPQRFGDKPFFTYDWGDSEIRFTWKTLTFGFGTQAIWLGAAYINPILHSNNAPTYPKFDIGLRKQKVIIPKLNWNLGYVEARYWLGYLSESAYFDNDSSNDHTMFHGLSLAYSPPISSELVFSINRVCLVDWKFENLKYVIPSKNNTNEDQKASFGISYTLPKAGLNIFGELGIDDFTLANGYVRYPFHTMVYSGGVKKAFNLPWDQLSGEVILELSNLEMSQDFQFQWPYSFYFHHNVTQGYTNRGQWLGTGVGTGGNSQYLGFKLYYPKGFGLLYFYRNNPDNNYLYKDTINTTVASPTGTAIGFHNFKASFSWGIGALYYITKSLTVSGEFSHQFIVNPTFESNTIPDVQFEDREMHNFRITLGIKYSL